jgi:DNA-directed RNA polymerase subunit K/omega
MNENEEPTIDSEEENDSADDNSINSEEEDEQIKQPNKEEDEEEEDDEENDEEDEEEEEEEKEDPNKEKKIKKIKIQKEKVNIDNNKILFHDEEDENIESDDDSEDENYLKKFDSEINKNYINDFHPECLIHNYEEIAVLSQVIRDSNNIIIDPLHKTIPFLTKYEKTRILGQRAKQIENGSLPFVKLPENIIDGYIIAELELLHKKIPFIIRRPIPGGAFEYWHVKDLEQISF